MVLAKSMQDHHGSQVSWWQPQDKVSCFVLRLFLFCLRHDCFTCWIWQKIDMEYKTYIIFISSFVYQRIINGQVMRKSKLLAVLVDSFKTAPLHILISVQVCNPDSVQTVNILRGNKDSEQNACPGSLIKPLLARTLKKTIWRSLFM